MGWIVWVFPKQWQRSVAFMTMIIVSIFIVYSSCQLINKDKLELNRMRTEDKLKLWNRSARPEWKVELLKIWGQGKDVPLEIWNKAIETDDTKVLITVAGHPWVPENIKEKLIATDNDVRIRISGILNTGDRELAIRLLAEERDQKIREQVASNPNTPPSILSDMADDPNVKIRIRVAMNQSTPQDKLEQFVHAKSVATRRAVAKNPRIPSNKKALAILKNDKDEKVRWAIAANHQTPSNVLRDMGKIKKVNNFGILGAVASNPNTPENILRDLNKLGHAYVDQKLASNKKIPVDLLKVLLTSKLRETRMIAGRNPKAPVAGIKVFAQNQSDVGMREAAASNPITSKGILEGTLLKDPDVSVRMAVAGNINTTQKTLIFLAKDQNPQVRAQVARNKNTPVEYLHLLVKDNNLEVIRSLAKNSSTPDLFFFRFSVGFDEQTRLNAISSIISLPSYKWRLPRKK